MGGRETHSSESVIFSQKQSTFSTPQSPIALLIGEAHSRRAWVSEHCSKPWVATMVAKAVTRMIAKCILIRVWCFEKKVRSGLKLYEDKKMDREDLSLMKRKESGRT